MSKHGSDHSKQGTPSPSESFGLRPIPPTHHSEVEGLVETLLEELSYGGRKNHLDDTMGMDTAREILRTALTTHSAKEYERGRLTA